jgi:hypothetical protein
MVQILLVSRRFRGGMDAPSSDLRSPLAAPQSLAHHAFHLLAESVLLGAKETGTGVVMVKLVARTMAKLRIRRRGGRLETLHQGSRVY